MMTTKLQELITDSLAHGKTYRRLGEEIGINHVSMAQYHRGEVEPSGKNLALIGKYYRVDFFELLEASSGAKAKAQKEGLKEGDQMTPEMRLLVEELNALPPTEQLRWLLKIRDEKEAHKPKVP